MSSLGRTWRWLRRRIVGRPPANHRVVPAAVNPRALQPPTPTFGLDLVKLRDRFAQMAIDGEAPGALAEYARHDTERFLRTVDLVPENASNGLEIGANPYFTTFLLAWFRPRLALSLTNFFGQGELVATQQAALPSPSGLERRQFTFANVNIEHDRLPWGDGSFEVVLYCEVLEHMTNDPVATLREIHRVLRPGGTLVLTTPNAARIENVTRLIAGLGIHDQYSGYGPYGRHNREYTLAEVRALLAHCGFEEEIAYTADVHANHAALHVRDPRRLVDLCGHRPDELGQYIFSRWRRRDDGVEARPAWLYRSLSPGELSSIVPLEEPRGSRY